MNNSRVKVGLLDFLIISESFEDWAGQEALYPPDASTMREHALEDAMQCFGFVQIPL